MRYHLFVCVLFFGGGWPALSQQQFRPLNREHNLRIERQLNNKDNFSHTCAKPFLESKIYIDSLEHADSTHSKKHEYQRWLARKLKSESLIVIDSGEFHLTIDPLFDFQYGKDFADTTTRADTTRFYTNTRGILIRADFGAKVSVMTSFLENQSFFPQYLDDFVKTSKVVPGNGRTKPFKFGGYDYAMASGYVSFSPVKNLNFQIGHDKNFIGDGYRSLLLSDNAYNYPFLKITSSFWNNRIQYTNLYTQLSSLDRIPITTTPEALFKPKTGTFHFLSIIPWKRLHIGLFEGIIWQRWDSTGTKPFDWNFINPVIFSNTLIYGSNGKNNALAGVNLKLKILPGLALFSQLVIDDVNKYGFQIGLKSFDLFNLKNFNFQAEYNTVQAKIYVHAVSLQDYSHYNQGLAHPFGNDFQELISFIDYRWRDFFVKGKVVYAQRKNTRFVSGNYLNTELFFNEMEIGYMLNNKTNLNIVAGLIDRTESNAVFSAGGWSNHHTQFFYFGIRTSLSNHYFDF